MLWFVEFGRGTALPPTPEEPPQLGDLADAVGKRPLGHYRWNCCSCELLSPCCDRTYVERQPTPSPAVDRSLVELAAVTNLPSFSGEVVVPRRRPPPTKLYVHPPLRRSPAPCRDWRMMADGGSMPEIAVLETVDKTLLPAVNQSSDATANDREDKKPVSRWDVVSRSFDDDVINVAGVSAVGNYTSVNKMCLPCSKSFETFPRRKNEYTSSKKIVVTQQLNAYSKDLGKYKLSTISSGVLSEDKQLLKGISFLPLLNTCIGKSEPVHIPLDGNEPNRPSVAEVHGGEVFHTAGDRSSKDLASKREVSAGNTKCEEIVLGRISPTAVTGALKKRSESQKSPSGKRTKGLSRAKTFHRSRTAYGKITGSLRKSSSPRVDYCESEAELEISTDSRRATRNGLPLDALWHLMPVSLAPDGQAHQKVFATSSGSTCSDFVTADSFSPCAEHATSSRRSTSSDLFATGSDVTASEMDTIFNDLHSYADDDDFENEMIGSEHLHSNMTVLADENELNYRKVKADDEDSYVSGIENSTATGMQDLSSSFSLNLQGRSSTQKLGDVETPKAQESPRKTFRDSHTADDIDSSTGGNLVAPTHPVSRSEDNVHPFGYGVAATFLDLDDRDVTEGMASSNEINLVTAGSDPSDSQAATTTITSCDSDATGLQYTFRTTSGSEVIGGGNVRKSLKTIPKKASSDSGINVGDKHFPDDDVNGLEVVTIHSDEVAVSIQNNNSGNAKSVSNSYSVRKRTVGTGETETGAVEVGSCTRDNRLPAETVADVNSVRESGECVGNVSGYTENKCFLL